MSIRILLVDDHAVLRSGLRSLITKDKDIEVVAEAGSGQAAVCLARETKPDVVIMDVSLPDFNGIEATRQIVFGNPIAKILALSMHSNLWYVEAILKAGGKGYICKEDSGEELIRAIRTIHAGETYLSPKVGDGVKKKKKRQMPVMESLPCLPVVAQESPL